jgi:hypothetical protein
LIEGLVRVGRVHGTLAFIRIYKRGKKKKNDADEQPFQDESFCNDRKGPDGKTKNSHLQGYLQR